VAKRLLVEWITNLWKSGERIQTYTLLQRLCTHIHQSFRIACGENKAFNLRDKHYPTVLALAVTLPS
jgi:hypothetical protein